MRRRSFLRALGSCGSMSIVLAHAQDPSDRPIRAIVPYPPGGAIDYATRLLVTSLQGTSRRTIVVENVPGAAGALGLQKLLREGADGTMFAVGTDSDVVLAPMVNSELRYAWSDFRFLGVISSAPMILVRPEAKSALNLGSLSRTPSTTLSLGNYGVGSNSHLLAMDLAGRLAINVVHVPYRGIAPLVQDLLSNQIDLAFLPLAGSVLETIRSGRLVALGVASADSVATLPGVARLSDVPGLRDFVHTSWAGVFVPEGLNEDSVVRLHEAVQRAIRDSAYTAPIVASGSTPGAPMSLVEAKAFLQIEAKRYAELSRGFRH